MARSGVCYLIWRALLMRKWSRYLAGVVAITGLLALVVNAGAETCKLETKRFDRTARSHLGRHACRVLVSIDASAVFLHADWRTARDDRRIRARGNSRILESHQQGAEPVQFATSVPRCRETRFAVFRLCLRHCQASQEKDARGRRTRRNRKRRPRQSEAMQRRRLAAS